MLPVYKINCWPVSAYISILLYDKNTVDVIIFSIFDCLLLVYIYIYTHTRVCAVLCCSVVSDSLPSHGLQSTRLLYPWDA